MRISGSAGVTRAAWAAASSGGRPERATAARAAVVAGDVVLEGDVVDDAEVVEVGSVVVVVVVEVEVVVVVASVPPGGPSGTVMVCPRYL